MKRKKWSEKRKAPREGVGKEEEVMMKLHHKYICEYKDILIILSVQGNIIYVVRDKIVCFYHIHR